MKFFIVVALLLAITSTARASSFAYYTSTPIVRSYPYVYSAHSSSLVTPTQTQYHNQDDLGQYAYGYAEPLSAKQESRSLDGITRGSYSYRDANGKLQLVGYTADANGFHVAATNLPRAVVPQPQQQPFRASESSETSAAVANIGDSISSPGNVHVRNYESDRLRGAAAGAAGVESHTAARGGGGVELRQPMADSIDAPADREHISNRYGAVKAVQSGRGFVPTIVETTVPVGVPSAVISPRIYGYGYPISSGLVAARYFY